MLQWHILRSYCFLAEVTFNLCWLIALYHKAYHIYCDNSRGTWPTKEGASFPGNSIFTATTNLSKSQSNSQKNVNSCPFYRSPVFCVFVDVKSPNADANSKCWTTTLSVIKVFFLFYKFRLVPSRICQYNVQHL